MYGGIHVNRIAKEMRIESVSSQMMDHSSFRRFWGFLPL